MSRALGRFAAGLALKGVLDRLQRPSKPRRGAAKRGRGPADGPVANQPARRGPLFFVMMGSLVAGLPLMLLFENTITRVLGVLAMFTFIIAGVFLIADPAFLAADDEERG